ncbi:peptidyl-prolyl cis-trans isomerase-like 3 isoform X3 [Petaurus breviceps papuanus]|uniref:peptidyl-prolyl cis-trans isomerase-like 3 isoform X3 n=1 Tax=Petaurus breviceps papuanus TaxID=3040969 RepID=UPI0036DAEE0F
MGVNGTRTPHLGLVLVTPAHLGAAAASGANHYFLRVGAGAEVALSPLCVGLTLFRSACFGVQNLLSRLELWSGGPVSTACNNHHLRFLLDCLKSPSSKMSVTLHTDVGDIKIEVFCERTPNSCENFLALCASNYYNGCIFHRNIKGFMVQTGDPTGSGKGGNSIWGRKFEDEYSEYLKHSVRGVVSMANNGPNTNGSQFFITYGKQPHLDMKYTVFGKVIDGLETLDELEKLPVNEKTFRPLNDVHIKDITIHANPFAP